EPLWIALRQFAEPHEQISGVAAITDRVLDPDRARELLRGVIVVEFLTDQTSDGQDLVGITDPLLPSRLGGNRLELVGQSDLTFPRHTDLDESRHFRSTIVSTSPGPTWASTLPARAESTVHAKVSPAGTRGARQRTETETVISS